MTEWLEGSEVALGNSRMILRVSARRTNGAAAVIEEIASSASSEPSVHVHANEDEIFFLIEGRHSLVLDDATFEKEAGDIVFAPRGVPHSHRFLSAGRAFIVLVPAGLESFFPRLSAMYAEGNASDLQLHVLASEFGLSFSPA